MEAYLFLILANKNNSFFLNFLHDLHSIPYFTYKISNKSVILSMLHLILHTIICKLLICKTNVKIKINQIKLNKKLQLHKYELSYVIID